MSQSASELEFLRILYFAGEVSANNLHLQNLQGLAALTNPSNPGKIFLKCSLENEYNHSHESSTSLPGEGSYF